MRARLLTWLLALLLLGMQQGAQWHAIAHLGDSLAQSHEQGPQLPAADTPCVACALFAGGSAAIHAGSSQLYESAGEFKAPQHATLSGAVATPHDYLARAPPPLP